MIRVRTNGDRALSSTSTPVVTSHGGTRSSQRGSRTSKFGTDRGGAATVVAMGEVRLPAGGVDLERARARHTGVGGVARQQRQQRRVPGGAGLQDHLRRGRQR